MKGNQTFMKGTNWRCLSAFQEFRCLWKNNCNITVSTRKYCKKCRLRKCFKVSRHGCLSSGAKNQQLIFYLFQFKVGMKPEYIVTEEQKRQQQLGHISAANEAINWQGKEESIESYAQNDTEIDQDRKPASGSALSKAREPVPAPKSACAKLELKVNVTATLNVQPQQDRYCNNDDCRYKTIQTILY